MARKPMTPMAQAVEAAPAAQWPRQPGLWPKPGGDRVHVEHCPAPQARRAARDLSLGRAQPSAFAVAALGQVPSRR